MNFEEIKSRISHFFQNNILYDESMDEINEEESLIENGYIDSIGLIGLVTYIEKAFQMKVLDQEIVPENFESLNKIYSYIQNKISA